MKLQNAFCWHPFRKIVVSSLRTGLRADQPESLTDTVNMGIDR
jgi:hypothetical protein